MIEIINGYTVERKKVKNINLRVREDLSVYISAPYNLDTYHIKRFIESKEDFIKKAIDRLKKIKEMYENNTLEEGQYIRYLGREYIIKIIINSSNKIELKENEIIFFISENKLEIKEKLLNTWYYQRSVNIFSKMIKEKLNVMNEYITKLKINNSKTKWGYCNYHKKEIFLNVALIKRSLFEIEYVIIHEITHLKVPNHSKQFYFNIEKYMPNYKQAEKLLKNKYIG